MLFNNHLFFIASIVMQLIFSSLAFGQDQNQDKKWIFQDNNQKESEKKTNYAVKRKLVTKTSNNTNDFRRLMHKTNRKKNINKSTNQAKIVIDLTDETENFFIAPPEIPINSGNKNANNNNLEIPIPNNFNPQNKAKGFHDLDKLYIQLNEDSKIKFIKWLESYVIISTMFPMQIDSLLPKIAITNDKVWFFFRDGDARDHSLVSDILFHCYRALVFFDYPSALELITFPASANQLKIALPNKDINVSEKLIMAHKFLKEVKFTPRREIRNTEPNNIHLAGQPLEKVRELLKNDINLWDEIIFFYLKIQGIEERFIHLNYALKITDEEIYQEAWSLHQLIDSAMGKLYK